MARCSRIAITLPEGYDPAKPARLYVWMHGRQNNTTESEFIFSQQTFRPGNVPVADQGQIQLDLFGRINSAGWHWAGEADVFEGIAAVKKRFKIDDKRVLLRGFSMGGEGAWHIALHYPDRFAAAEIGAGTWSRRAQTPGLAPYQYATLKIWENMEEWALNAFNLPLAGHDGDTDTQIASLPGPPPGTPTRGQLGIFAAHARPAGKGGLPGRRRARFPAHEGHAGHLPDLAEHRTRHQSAGAPAARRLSEGVGRQGAERRPTTFASSPTRRATTATIGFRWTVWRSTTSAPISMRSAATGGEQYEIKTHNVTRLVLRETEHAKTIDDRWTDLKVKSGSEITLEKTGADVEEWTKEWRTGRTAQDACAAGADRRCLPRSLPAGASDRHAMERGRESAGAALAGALRPAVGQILSRPSLREGRQGRDDRGHGEVSRRAVRRPGQQ